MRFKFVLILFLITLTSCPSSDSLRKKPIHKKCPGIYSLTQSDMIVNDSSVVKFRKGLGIFDTLIYKLAKVDGSDNISDEDLISKYKTKTSSYSNLSTPAEVRTAWNANASAYCQRIITLNELIDNKNISQSIKDKAANKLLEVDNIYNEFIKIVNSDASGSYEEALKKKN